MRAGLPQKEPELLARWAARPLRPPPRRRQGRADFVLHDGPPYANGAIHMGNALSKMLKDVVSRAALGFDVDYVPGWDCHGLPIEWKVEEEFRAKGKSKDEVSKTEFRRGAATTPQHWIDVQSAEFRRLGGVGDWDHYSDHEVSGRGGDRARVDEIRSPTSSIAASKPVMWSPVERTALADAEVEYEDYTSDTVWVKFPIPPWASVHN